GRIFFFADWPKLFGVPSYGGRLPTQSPEFSDRWSKTVSAKTVSAKTVSAKTVSAKTVSAKTVSAKTVSAKTVSAKTVSAKTVSAKKYLIKSKYYHQGTQKVGSHVQGLHSDTDTRKRYRELYTESNKTEEFQ